MAVFVTFQAKFIDKCEDSFDQMVQTVQKSGQVPEITTFEMQRPRYDRRAISFTNCLPAII